MKKFYFLTLAALVALFSFTACGDDKETDEPTPGKKTALQTPALSLENQTVEGFTVVWGAVANAANYTYELNGETHTTVNTRAQFIDLAPGTYTVRVKANPAENSDRYTSSQWASISATIESNKVDQGECDWFEAVLFKEGAKEDGVDTTTELLAGFIGTGVVEVKVGIWPTETTDSADDEEIMQYLEPITDSEWIAEINSEGGLVLLYSRLTPATSFTLCAYAKNSAGQTVFVRSECTTDSAEPNPMRDQWLGTWNAQTTKTLTWDVPAGAQSADFTFGEGVSNFTMTITPDQTYPNQVIISGLSTFSMEGVSAPAVGVITEDGKLEIFSGIQLTEYDNEGYAIFWYTIMKDPADQIGLYLDQIPVYTFTLTGDKAESEMVPLTNEGQSGSFTPMHMEVCVTNRKSIKLVWSELPAVCRAGEITMTRAASTMSSKKPVRMSKNKDSKFKTSYIIAR